MVSIKKLFLFSAVFTGFARQNLCFADVKQAKKISTEASAPTDSFKFQPIEDIAEIENALGGEGEVIKPSIGQHEDEYTLGDEPHLIDPERLPGDKKSFRIKRGDGKINFGGRVKEEYFFYKNPVTLNDALPDQYSYFRTVLDLTTKVSWGKLKYGHKAFEGYIDFRHKSEWGLAGRTTKTNSASVKVSQTETGNHNHFSQQPLVWVKDAWMKLSMNAILAGYATKAEKLHYLKLGYFPFALARGISLGSGYGTFRDFLGVGNRINDFSAPGILLTGSIVKDCLDYDLYYARYEEKGKAAEDTLATTRANQIGRRLNPFRGIGKDDQLWAAQLRWRAVNDDTGKLDLTPYILYNDAPAKQIEFPDDNMIKLGTTGIEIEYYMKNGFEFGGEAAFNFGHQDVLAIDRNIIKMQAPKVSADNVTVDCKLDGFVQEVYSHVRFNADGFDANSTDKLPKTACNAPVISNVKSAIANNTNFVVQCDGTLPNNGIFSNDPHFRSNSDRFRPCFRNYFRGWMAVLDAAYNLKEYDLKFAAGVGFASGDEDPRNVEKTKNYKGFVGLHELYTGGRIKSLYFLDDRSIKRPLSLNGKTGETEEADVIDNEIATDSNFTDLFYVGIGSTWSPVLHGHKLSINPNLVFFWKDHPSPAFDAFTMKLLSTNASRFLGTELNILAEYEIFRDLKLYTYAAVFRPGGFYHDIKGAPLPKDASMSLQEVDQQQVNLQNFRISDNVSYFINTGLEYRF